MVSNKQLQLIHIAARQAGLIVKKDDRRYRLLLAQYKAPNGRPAKSSRQLNNSQIGDLLAICESMGFDSGRGDTYFRDKVAAHGHLASFAQQSAILHLRGDLGWNAENLKGFIRRMTADARSSVAELTTKDASNIIEALKNMTIRNKGMSPNTTLNELKDMEVANGKEKQSRKIRQ
jgi:Bacteriophage Mu, GemA protein